jgi:hypothetical protein
MPHKAQLPSDGKRLLATCSTDIPVPILPDGYDFFFIYEPMCNIFSYTRTLFEFLPNGYASHGYPLQCLPLALGASPIHHLMPQAHQVSKIKDTPIWACFDLIKGNSDFLTDSSVNN